MNRNVILALLIIAVPCFGSSGKPFIDSYEKILLKLEAKKQVADKKGQGLLFDRMLSKAHLTLEKLQKTKKCSENHQNLMMEIEKILLILKELTYIPTPKGTVIEEKLKTKYYIQPTSFVSVPSSPDRYKKPLRPEEDNERIPCSSNSQEKECFISVKHKKDITKEID